MKNFTFLFISILFVIGCTNNQSEFVGEWVIIKELKNGKRGGNLVQVEKHNDSLYLVFSKSKRYKLKDEKDTLYTIEEPSVKIYFDNDKKLNILGDGYLLVYTKTDSDASPEKNEEIKKDRKIFHLDGRWVAIQDKPKYEHYGKPISILNIQTKGQSISFEYDWRGYSKGVFNYTGKHIGDGKFETAKGELTYNEDFDVIYFNGKEHKRQ